MNLNDKEELLLRYSEKTDTLKYARRPAFLDELSKL